MDSLNWRLKPTATTSAVTLCKQSGVLFGVILDRLTSLPDDVLIHILSFLPTKDAAAFCFLSKRFRRLFPLLTSLDFDGSPIYHCLRCPYAVERFPTFVAFVDNVLLAHKSPKLTRLRLHVCVDFITMLNKGCTYQRQNDFPSFLCNQGCFPDLNSLCLSYWISFPLTHCGLRELDLCFLVKESGDAQLPLEIFTCKTLEVLKLDFNLGLDRISNIPSFSLPNLKLLRLCALYFPTISFLPSLFSGCPLLEDLTLEGLIEHVDPLAIYSRSLKRLRLEMDSDDPNINYLASLHTPNLEYLKYSDALSQVWSIDPMNCLVEVDLHICKNLLSSKYDDPDSFQYLLSLIRSVFCVKRLTFGQGSLLKLDCELLKYQLPVFPNLKHLALRNYIPDEIHWDNLLMALLNCSPILETLVIMGLGDFFGYIREDLESELEFFRKNEVIPSCFRYYLKEIVITSYFGVERELIIIQFLLRHALVLEKLVIRRAEKSFTSVPKLIPDKISVENTLKDLPRASITCSFQVL